MGRDINQQVIFTDQLGGGVFDNIERFLGGNDDDVITLRDYACLDCEADVATVFIDGGAGDDVLFGINRGISDPGGNPLNDDDWIIGGTGADTIDPGSGPNTIYLGDDTGPLVDGDLDVLVYEKDSFDTDLIVLGNGNVIQGDTDILFGMGLEDVIDVRDILAGSSFYRPPGTPAWPVEWTDFNNFFSLADRGGGDVALVYDSDAQIGSVFSGDVVLIKDAPSTWGFDLQTMIDAGNIQVL